MNEIIILRWLRLFLVGLLVIVLTMYLGTFISVNAQCNSLVIGLGKDVSGDGMGANYSPALFYGTSKSQLGLAALI